MKSFTQFFQEKKTDALEYKIKCHIDGISIDGIGSIRVSNISKNLLSLMNSMATLGKNLPTFLLSACNVLVYKTQACDLNPHSSFAVYLSNLESKNSILVRHNRGNSFSQSLNNTCSFFISNQQSGTYQQAGCYCPSGFPYDFGGVYDMVLSAKNVSDEKVGCVNTFLQAVCPADPAAGAEALALVIIGGIVLVGFCCVDGCRWLGHRLERHRPENIALLSSPSSPGP